MVSLADSHPNNFFLILLEPLCCHPTNNDAAATYENVYASISLEAHDPHIVDSSQANQRTYVNLNKWGHSPLLKSKSGVSRCILFMPLNTRQIMCAGNLSYAYGILSEYTSSFVIIMLTFWTKRRYNNALHWLWEFRPISCNILLIHSQIFCFFGF